MTNELLDRSASWTENHGFGDNACGTRSWASVNRPVGDGDWVEHCKAFVDHGMPGVERDPQGPDHVRLAGVRRLFSAEVTALPLGRT